MIYFIREKIQDWWRGNLGGQRSPEWQEVRREFLKTHPACAVCGGIKKLEVHHVKDFSNHHELELSPDNLITLCNAPWRRCHFIFGHFYNYRLINPNVREDAKKWYQKSRAYLYEKI